MILNRRIFYKEHKLDLYVEYGVPAKIARFDSDVSIANAWKMLEAGNFTKEDMQLLRHETAEAWYMRNHGPSYATAHNAAQIRYPAPNLDNTIAEILDETYFSWFRQ